MTIKAELAQELVFAKNMDYVMHLLDVPNILIEKLEKEYDKKDLQQMIEETNAGHTKPQRHYLPKWAKALQTN